MYLIFSCPHSFIQVMGSFPSPKPDVLHSFQYCQYGKECHHFVCRALCAVIVSSWHKGSIEGMLPNRKWAFVIWGTVSFFWEMLCPALIALCALYKRCNKLHFIITHQIQFAVINHYNSEAEGTHDLINLYLKEGKCDFYRQWFKAGGSCVGF